MRSVAEIMYFVAVFGIFLSCVLPTAAFGFVSVPRTLLPSSAFSLRSVKQALPILHRTSSVATSPSMRLPGEADEVRGFMASLTFTNQPYSKAIKLLHSPLQWAEGAGVLLGLPVFNVTQVHGPFIVGNRKMLQLCAVERESKQTRSVIFTSTTPEHCSIRLFSGVGETTIRLHVHAYEPSGAGFILAVDVCDYPAAAWSPEGLRKTLNMRECFPPEMTQLLRIGLLACVNPTAEPEYEVDGLAAIQRYTQLAIDDMTDLSD
jgi:hypothetical protein